MHPEIFQSALKAVENVWNKTIPEYPFDYFFIDEDYNNLFRSQLRLTGLLKYFTILAVIIACLGLIRIICIFNREKDKRNRDQESYGSGHLRILYSMVKEFLLLVLISLIIALPAGWIIVSNLLKQFASRIEMKIYVFAIIAMEP